MRPPRPTSPKAMLLIGLLTGGIGLFFCLVGAGLLPVPGGKRNLNAPLWVVFCAGLTFLLAGVSFLFHLAAKGNPDGELPAGSPRWMHVVRYLIGLAILACFGAMTSWVAFGPGERNITMSVPFWSGPANEIVGRSVFGFGAVVMWLGTLAFAVFGTRKLGGQ